MFLDVFPCPSCPSPSPTSWKGKPTISKFFSFSDVMIIFDFWFPVVILGSKSVSLELASAKKRKSRDELTPGGSVELGWKYGGNTLQVANET